MTAPRRRPPWWPADEPWPPSGPPWRHGRRGGRWRRGFGCLFGLVFVVLVSALLVLVSTILGALGLAGTGPGALQVAALVVMVVALVVIVAAARAFRSAAGTLDELVEATRRVESGDLTARVATPARGPGPVRDLARGFNTMAERLEVDERQRRSLLADVAHELRTPLAVIRGNVEAIVDGVRPADRANLDALLDETDVLTRLVEDLRTVTLSEAGTLPLHREPTDVDVLLAETVAGFQAAADAAGVELAVDAPDDLPVLDVDPVRLREVVANLLANALRYTPSGGRVRVVAALVGSDGDRRLELTVVDTGAGIPPDLLPRVFERFARTPESRGSGLGLAIARNLVVAHGGTITAESRPGEGTTIRVRLPAPEGPPGRS